MENGSFSKIGVPLDDQSSEFQALVRESKRLQDIVDSTIQFKKFADQIKISVSKEGLRIGADREFRRVVLRCWECHVEIHDRRLA